VEKLKTHGGSLRVYLAHAAATRRPSPRVSELLEHEIERGFLEIETYAQFSERVRRTKRNLLSFLIAAKEQGKTICGYGAPGKGNTLLNYCGIGTDFLDFTVDRNPYKTAASARHAHPHKAGRGHRRGQARLRPPPSPEPQGRDRAPDAHMGDWGGKFIIPIPDVHVIEPSRSVS
jgi:hypothetical protein